MERTNEQWFEIQISLREENYWVREGSDTYDTARRGRHALRKARREAAKLSHPKWEHRMVRVTRTEEVWPDRHIQVLTGRCPECGHSGRDCTGIEASGVNTLTGEVTV